MSRAAAGEESGGAGPTVSTSSLDELEVAVPRDQRPSNELAALKETNLYSWALLSTNEYVKRLALIFFGSFAAISAPISYASFDPSKQPVEFFLAGAVGSLFLVAIVTIRIYLGWDYVGTRLLSATYPYEETGWYDGEIFVKPPEILARDRLLGTYTVRPILKKLRQTLLTAAGGLLGAYFILGVLINVDTDAQGQYGRAKPLPEPTQRVTAPPKKTKDCTSIADLIYDEELAESSLAAMKLEDVPNTCPK